MIKLTYIYHDCFLLESRECSAVFDYWRDGEAADALPRFLSEIDRGKPLYVFVSHHHKDHFTRSIFSWGLHFPDVRYVISNDTHKLNRYMFSEGSLYAGYRPSADVVHTVSPGDHLELPGIAVDVFGSTDIGNSYLVKVDGCRVFHAGDLNAWVWKDESTEAEVDAAIRDFKEKIEPMREVAARVDLAMFPVDSRIGRDYWEGASIFVRMFDVGCFVPMHFCLGEDEEQRARLRRDACRFKEYANPERGCYVALQQPYSSLAITSGHE